MHPSCINPLADQILEPYYKSIGKCNDIQEMGYRVDQNGDFLLEDCLTKTFTSYYDTKQGVTGFGGLFTNKQNMNDKFVAYWDVASARFAHNPYVIGIDPLNEPAPANPIKDPTLQIPGVMDRKHLAPTYAKIFDKAIQNDKDSILWFEPIFDPDVDWQGGVVHPIGFSSPPGGEIGSAHHVLNDHAYCCELGTDPSPCGDAGEPDPAFSDVCQSWLEQRIGTRAKDAKRLGIPYHVTEFGACYSELPCTQEISQVTSVADENLVGWAYWQLKQYGDITTAAGTSSEGFYNKDGSLQDWKVKALTRSYPMFT